MLRSLVIAAGLALISGAAAAPAPSAGPAGVASPARTLLPVKDVMSHIVNPAAELYWKASGDVETAEGDTHRAPSADDDARWNAAVDAAAALQESGNLLMMRGRARDDGPWMRFAQQLADAGALAVDAARQRDEAKTFAAGSALYDACFGCHGRYIPRSADQQRMRQTPDEDFKPPK